MGEERVDRGGAGGGTTAGEFLALGAVWEQVWTMKRDRTKTTREKNANNAGEEHSTSQG